MLFQRVDDVDPILRALPYEQIVSTLSHDLTAVISCDRGERPVNVDDQPVGEACEHDDVGRPMKRAGELVSLCADLADQTAAHHQDQAIGQQDDQGLVGDQHQRHEDARVEEVIFPGRGEEIHDDANQADRAIAGKYQTGAEGQRA